MSCSSGLLATYTPAKLGHSDVSLWVIMVIRDKFSRNLIILECHTEERLKSTRDVLRNAHKGN